MINSATCDVREEIRKIVGPQGVDVFVENTGNVRLIETAYELTASRGRTILVGVPRHDQNINIHSLPLHHGKVLDRLRRRRHRPGRRYSPLRASLSRPAS